MCQKNVGRLDAYIRISTGIMMTGMGIMRDKSWLVAMGSMKIAEGITRYCPILDLIGYTTLPEEECLEELLGPEYDDEIEIEHECQCVHHDYEDDHNDDRRQYIHRGIKRNQYQNRNY